MNERKCKLCRNDLSKKQKSFCSRKCNSKSQVKKESWKVVSCLTCLKEFKGRLHRKYCSSECYQETLRGKKLTEEHKKKISKSHVGKVGHPCSEKNKQLFSENWKGSKNPKWVEDREALALRQKMRGICHGFVKRCIREKGVDKIGTTIEILGYSPQEFRNHIESLWLIGMSWENHSYYGWHIDHIKPLSSFDKNVTIREMNSLSNLQPLWWFDNLKKGSK